MIKVKLKSIDIIIYFYTNLFKHNDYINYK